MVNNTEEGKKYKNLASSLKSSDYFNALVQIRDDLNLPARTSHAEVEALLLYAIHDTYGENRKADMALMALALLNGFSNRWDRVESNQERDLYSERRENFLKYTNYIAVTYKNYSSYDAAKSDVKTEIRNGKEEEICALKTIRGTIDSNTTRYLANVISILHGKKDINDYLKAAKDNLTHEKGVKESDWKKWNHIPENLLPPLKYYKQVPPVLPQSSKTEPSNPERTDIDIGAENAQREKNQFIKEILKLVLLIIIACGLMWLIFTRTLAEKHGQFEVHTSSCYMRLDFSRSDYEGPSIISGNTVYYGDGIIDTQIK